MISEIIPPLNESLHKKIHRLLDTDIWQIFTTCL
jgi:hypothetical protein